MCTIISVNSIFPFQTAPTAVFGKSGQIFVEGERGKEEMIVYEYQKQELDFGEKGRKELSDDIISEKLDKYGRTLCYK